MKRIMILLPIILATGCGGQKNLTEAECARLMDKQVSMMLAEASPGTEVEFSNSNRPSAAYKNACKTFGPNGRAIYECTMAANTRVDANRCMTEKIVGVKL
jgi:hypothetical protein